MEYEQQREENASKSSQQFPLAKYQAAKQQHCIIYRDQHGG